MTRHPLTRLVAYTAAGLILSPAACWLLLAADLLACQLSDALDRPATFRDINPL